MKRASAIVFCLAVCLLASASVVQAGGFALYEWSARGVAMGTTGYAQGVDSSVIATNPALMTQVPGQSVLAGATLITPQSSVVLDGQKSKTKAKIFMVPHAYYSKQMESNENVWLGVGMFTRFGLGTHYDENWQGRGSLHYVDVQSVSMNPNVAFKFNDHLSVAVGAEVLKGSFDLQRKVPVLGADRTVSFHTKGYGFGGNIGVHYQFDDQWAAGFTYRSPMHLSTTGSGQNEIPGQVTFSTTEQELSATLPSSYTLAASYKPTDRWVFEMDTVYTRWEVTDKIEYTGTINATTPLHYKNAWRFQLGAEYWMLESLALRLGYAYDQTPTRAGDASFMLPANDRQLFSTGLGYKAGNFTADWSFMYVVTKERHGLSIDNPAPGAGSWSVDFKDGKTWISGLSLGYAF